MEAHATSAGEPGTLQTDVEKLGFTVEHDDNPSVKTRYCRRNKSPQSDEDAAAEGPAPSGPVCSSGRLPRRRPRTPVTQFDFSSRFRKSMMRVCCRSFTNGSLTMWVPSMGSSS